MVKNLPCNAGNTGSIPHWRPRIPHAAEQISRHTTITEPVGHNKRPRMPRLGPDPAKRIYTYTYKRTCHSQEKLEPPCGCVNRGMVPRAREVSLTAEAIPAVYVQFILRTLVNWSIFKEAIKILGGAGV